ncbi:MAG: DUF5414 family protein [Parachlamydiaceae bacterium]|nr:DUF5414 family protein [Parachlamydiaceae bacterium]
MIDAKKIKQMDLAFQRILILPMTRSTFRQMQNVIFQSVDGNREEANTILEALITNANKKGQTPDTPLQDFFDRYTIPVGVAREVAERGEFVSLVTSDIISHPQMPIFGNRIRRVDGKEFDFISDAESCVQLLQHFSIRLQEMDKAEKSRNVLKGLKSELTTLKNRIEELIKSSENS